jgi:tetratricopeptide (TPR) repeat protein
MEQAPSPSSLSAARLEKLHKFLAATPNDPFLLYAIALEHKKTDSTKAIEYLQKTLTADPHYCYAYFQLGQVLEGTGDLDAARKAYTDGITAAEKAGDAHAGSELAGALSMIQ